MKKDFTATRTSMREEHYLLFYLNLLSIHISKFMVSILIYARPIIIYYAQSSATAATYTRYYQLYPHQVQDLHTLLSVLR